MSSNIEVRLTWVVRRRIVAISAGTRVITAALSAILSASPSSTPNRR